MATLKSLSVLFVTAVTVFFFSSSNAKARANPPGDDQTINAPYFDCGIYTVYDVDVMNTAREVQISAATFRITNSVPGVSPYYRRNPSERKRIPIRNELSHYYTTWDKASGERPYLNFNSKERKIAVYADRC